MEDSKEVLVKPPHWEDDWKYFKGLSNKFQMKSYFDQVKWTIGSVHLMRIIDIYDPSHFWVITEEKAVDILHKYINDFYSQHHMHYKLSANYFGLKMPCVCLVCNEFYRVILMNVPLQIEKTTWVFVFLMDFGYTAKVPIDQIYFMTKNLYDVPQFAVRATLSGLGPINQSYWSSVAVTQFVNLVSNKVCYGQVTNVDEMNKCLFLQLRDQNNYQFINSMITDHLAKSMTLSEIREIRYTQRKASKHGKIPKLPFLLPSFAELEYGLAGDIHKANEVLREYQGVNLKLV
ncbi:uncharacterized protein [Euwallacea similis]|uniref:uncharacterized protein n=1 Tax=Euwallacea similis TaxID=1736056 RepID=UPI00344DB6EC